MAYTDLRSKTPFDFTSDKKILKKLGLLDPETPDFLSRLSDTSRAFLLLDYAELVNNIELKNAVEKEFEEEIESYFNE